MYIYDGDRNFESEELKLHTLLFLSDGDLMMMYAKCPFQDECLIVRETWGKQKKGSVL